MKKTKSRTNGNRSRIETRTGTNRNEHFKMNKARIKVIKVIRVIKGDKGDKGC